ncbi:hypothetical protein [Lactobacillus xujianguonis]|uniref:hypothetical protein n=1 Tax=Lactobacillus xujianguonis TaxID=2495899 RepID=UPI000FDB9D85|nr:hypothetical protein [Lactobacillus xujianguonis]RVU74110.1 hypothetical protein EJK20_04730 [Lactobacillus xujianguonis]
MFLAISQNDWFWISFWVIILATAFHWWKWVWLAIVLYIAAPALLTLLDGLWRIALVIAIAIGIISVISYSSFNLAAWIYDFIKKKIDQHKAANNTLSND